MALEPEAAITAPKVTVGYSRKVSIRPYESAEASIFVQADIAVEPDGSVALGSVQEAATRAFYEAKVVVLDQLCLPYEVLDNVVVEQIDKVLGPVEVVSSTERTNSIKAVNNPQPQSGGKRPGWASEIGADEKDQDLLKAELAEHPDRWFDNRENKKNPKAPDYKRKFTGNAIWPAKVDA